MQEQFSKASVRQHVTLSWRNLSGVKEDLSRLHDWPDLHPYLQLHLLCKLQHVFGLLTAHNHATSDLQLDQKQPED